MIRWAAFVLGAVGAALLLRRDAPASAEAPSEYQPEPAPADVIEMAQETIKDAVSGAAAVFGTKYDSLIRIAAEENGLAYETLWRLLWQESRFREDIITGVKRSPVGALGIAQFMPATAREWLGSEAAALDYRLAIPGAARYLAWLIRQFGGDITRAVAAYNWGIGNVQRKGLAVAPSETRQYVLNITGEKLA